MSESLITIAAVVATASANLRWLRVAQREHYLGGAVSLFMRRWWYAVPVNLVLWVVAILALMTSAVFQSALLVVALVVVIGPVGLGIRGRTSKLAWTRRMKALAATVVALEAAVVAVGVSTGFAMLFSALVALTVPSIVELGLLLRNGPERKAANEFVSKASKRLNQVAPLVVGITGSYGKTSTKIAVAHLLSARKAVVASPASYNNRAGLSRAINEQLTPGTEVFVAEMGTYGPGEIEELCSFCPPSISVFTAIGPVHLERFGSEAAIIAAKSEIFETAEVAVVNVDDHRLAGVADRLEQSGKAVWRCGTSSTGARVVAYVEDDQVVVVLDGKVIASTPDVAISPSNLACAVAVALELEVSIDAIAARLAGIPSPPHRREVTVNAAGVEVIDDTFNLNPASGRSALELLSVGGQRRILVTPGMIELGSRQKSENTSFIGVAAETATDVVIVGRTNKKALLDGAGNTALNVVTEATLAAAVDWVRANSRAGDRVLYANDLPDHYP